MMFEGAGLAFYSDFLVHLPSNFDSLERVGFSNKQSNCNFFIFHRQKTQPSVLPKHCIILNCDNLEMRCVAMF